MAIRPRKCAAVALSTLLLVMPLTAQVFTVGERTAMQDVPTGFAPTSVPLPAGHLSERGRRELERALVAEQGFAHRPLPLGSGLTLVANGPMTPGGEKYKRLLFEKGQSAAAGDRVIVTAVEAKGNRLVVDFNGGPFAKHRFLSHVQINNGGMVAPQEQATGARVTLIFPEGLPEIAAPDVKALLEPVIDFGVKTSEEAYADTLPPPLRDAIAAHEVLVGMDRRMVIAALGQPESKVRERGGADGQQAQYEEWIFGHQPETVRFVRFKGERVTQLEVAELGKPIQIRTKDEVNGFTAPPPEKRVQLGDRVPGTEDPNVATAAPAPTLRRAGEAAPPSSSGKVQMPPSSLPAGPVPPLPDPTPTTPDPVVAPVSPH